MIRCMQSYVTWRLAVPVPGDLARARNVLGNRARLDRLSISGQGWTGNARYHYYFWSAWWSSMSTIWMQMIKFIYRWWPLSHALLGSMCQIAGARKELRYENHPDPHTPLTFANRC